MRCVSVMTVRCEMCECEILSTLAASPESPRNPSALLSVLFVLFAHQISVAARTSEAISRASRRSGIAQPPV